MICGLRTIFVLIFIFGLSTTSCGRKTLPIPPEDALPQAITDLSFQQDENKIILNWTAPEYTTAGSKLPNIDSFEILRAGIPEKDFCAGCPVSFTSSFEISAEIAITDPKSRAAQYTEMILRPGHRFFYKVRSKAGWRLISEDSNIVSFSWNSPAKAPESPTAISGDMEVMLSWLPVTTLIDGQQIDNPLYQVFRSRLKQNFEPIGQPVAVPAFVDSGLVNGQQYFYKISAIQLHEKNKITGLASHVVSSTPKDMTAPAPPRNITVVQLADGVKILWDKAAEKDIAGYRVYRRAATETTMQRIGQVDQAQFSFTDQPATAKAGLYYAVTAYDRATPANESPKSKEIFYEPF
nr:fibronectin type III domain-containing protein [Desulfobulbaceae bacterium]